MCPDVPGRNTCFICGAGASPAVLQRAVEKEIAGKTQAPHRMKSQINHVVARL
jgi:hypothetical protein